MKIEFCYFFAVAVCMAQKNIFRWWQEPPPVPVRRASGGSNTGFASNSAENSPEPERRETHATHAAPAAESNEPDIPSDEVYKQWTEDLAQQGGKGKDHRKQPWYLGLITRQNSEMLLLANGRSGDFLIRNSTVRVYVLLCSTASR